MALHPSMSGIERPRPRQAHGSPAQRPALLAKQAVLASAYKLVATYHRKRQPPQAPRGPQSATERVAPQEDTARTHAGSPKAEPYQKGVAPPRGKHARTMTQWSPVKGANLLVDPRAAQRRERREQRYPAPPVPPVEPPPTYDFSKRFRKPHATRGGADFGRSSVRAQRPAAMACCESVP